jgi:hypothetical protein
MHHFSCASTIRFSLSRFRVGSRLNAQGLNKHFQKSVANSNGSSVNSIVHASLESSLVYKARNSNGEKRSRQIVLLLKPSLYEKISVEAKKRGVSMNDAVNGFLEAALVSAAPIGIAMAANEKLQFHASRGFPQIWHSRRGS